MGTCPGTLGNARACLVGHLCRKMLSQAKSRLKCKGEGRNRQKLECHVMKEEEEERKKKERRRK